MISTGLQKLDDFLSGGIPNGVITDIYGGSGTGKTQLLFQICINAIKNGGNVLYQDTTGSFRPERILEIQKQQNLTFDILEKITVSRITNTSEQLKSINVMNASNFSLIVIDNVTDLFSYEYPKDDAERFSWLSMNGLIQQKTPAKKILAEALSFLAHFLPEFCLWQNSPGGSTD